MTKQQPNKRPPVPGLLARARYDSEGIHDKKGGAKNLRYKAGCHSNFYIATYNARSISSEARIHELEYAIKDLKWDIIGISETRIKGENLAKLRSDHILFSRGNENDTHAVVGFLINKNHARNILETKGISNRVAYTIIKISAMITIKIIQVYAPTTSYDDEEVIKMYEEIEEAMISGKSKFTYIIGDFNAKVGPAKKDEFKLGKLGLGQRNDRGDMLNNIIYIL